MVFLFISYYLISIFPCIIFHGLFILLHIFDRLNELQNTSDYPCEIIMNLTRSGGQDKSAAGGTGLTIFVC